VLQVFAQDRELVAAEASDGVAGTKNCFDATGDRDQEFVARFMAEAVVHILESVEVDEQHAGLRARSTTARNRELEPVEEQHTVR
jgi:hypothetical protein